MDDKKQEGVNREAGGQSVGAKGPVLGHPVHIDVASAMGRGRGVCGDAHS